jgi:hypothetical protein
MLLQRESIFKNSDLGGFSPAKAGCQDHSEVEATKAAHNVG